MSYPRDILSAEERETVESSESLIGDEQDHIVEYLLSLLANARVVACQLAMALEENKRYEVVAKYRVGNRWLRKIEEPK